MEGAAAADAALTLLALDAEGRSDIIISFAAMLIEFTPSLR